MAHDSVWKQLKHFSKAEFKHPELMKDEFLLVLDKARELAGVPFKLNSDARTQDENNAAKGRGSRSAHLLGNAVDIDVKHNDYATISRILTGIYKSVMFFRAFDNLGLELVNESHDSHIHFDLGGTFTNDGYVILRPYIWIAKD